ncbi:membrane hypothetical protein [metagenome]|uniref:Uncharacterized protein n=1 Tax=metagenome TaxID=256318 RepID=A0A2P2C117_9ZZZZ
MRLLQVEITRLRWRRAVVILLAACVLVPAVIFAGLAWNTRPVSDSDRADAQAQVDAEAQQPYVQKELKRCLKNPGRYGVDQDDLEGSCEQMVLPQLEWYLYREQLDVRHEIDNSGTAVVTILVGLMMLIGTTFVGLDWASGSMSNQLLFEPRRLRVWLAKATAVFLTALIGAAVVLAAYWAGLGLLASMRDLHTSADTWELVRNSSARGALLVACAALGGYALTMLFRSTVATLGVLFAFAVGGSLLIVGVIGQDAERWLLPTNFIAVLNDGVSYYSDAACGVNGQGTCEAYLSLADGAAYLGVLLVVSLVLSVLSFTRRDVP